MNGTEQTATLEVNGVRLYTRRVGDGPPAVVLHGGPGAHHDYLLPQYDRLAGGRALFYYDQRGGGKSPVPRDTPVGWREHVADLEALRGHWGLDRLTLLDTPGAACSRCCTRSSTPTGSRAWRSCPPRPSRPPGATNSSAASPPEWPNRGLLGRG